MMVIIIIIIAFYSGKQDTGLSVDHKLSCTYLPLLAYKGLGLFANSMKSPVAWI